ncbi:hypothetical protein [Legionella longbeachae]|uniref:Uncharacterized protein n=1 Tax=Legionella longbeachae serogroup 1 (strain NSW150) TaxID=661367 RepID=D3HTP8_LEGLN|nr:hypothetical protein [Legionella longbeachae]VEE02805.1 Uncharacterised protein [Legionella oakridgensis]HBD7397983.1 hypothetical protein [Legionella pneumophila]ARB90947.1 hypothetical protein A6J40_01485 [Legionella longbeachae]ARM32624.1 hypothetical protein B0B39_03425 [Legionella longbeachae]EEZ94606.1 hypothetical protein LLB_3520 [Legionella longbeachae D-4968]
MVQATFFIQRDTPPIEKNDLKTYYIPIVEIIDNMQQVSAWNYARNPLVSRLFYTSTDALFAQEALEAGRITVSCYKVLLNAAHISTLNKSKSVGKGHLMALNFMPKDILSCIKISGYEYNEVKNPFYQASESVACESSLIAPCA